MPLKHHVTCAVWQVCSSSALFNKHYLALLIPYVRTTQARTFPCYAIAVCMPFGLSQLRKRNLVSAAEYCFVCACKGFTCSVFFVFVFLLRAKARNICVHPLPTVRSVLHLSMCPIWINSFRQCRSHQNCGRQQMNSSPSPLLPHKYFFFLNHFYTHCQEESDVHTPTRSGKHKLTDTYTLWRGWSWRCVLCNSGVKWSPTPTRP